MKKFVLIIACLLLVILCFTACNKSFSSDYNEEILKNGTFEENAKTGWTYVAGENDTTTPTIKSTIGNSEFADAVGSYYLSITASEYSGYTQKVCIEKNSVYYLSAKVRISSLISSENSTLGGAFVAVDSDYTLVSAVKKAKTNNWETIGTYFNSGNRTSVLIRFGVGTEEYNASGTADFDSISLVKVVAVPEGTIASDLHESLTADTSYDALYRSNKEGKVFMVLAAVLGALCLYAAYAAFRTMMGRKGAFLSAETQDQKISFFKSSAFILIICELFAFAVRLIMVNFVYGGNTLGGYVTEASRLKVFGASDYYFNEKVVTPIGSLYLLWMLGSLASPLKLAIGDIGFSIFLKIPAVLADLVIVFLIYYIANRKYNQYISAIFAGIYAIFPVFFFISSGWGAYASIGVLFMLLSLISILDKKYVQSIIYYAVALLFSTEALLLAPLLLIYLGYVFFKSDEYKMGISITLTSAIIGLYLISIPFILTYFTAGRPFIVVTRYCQAFLAHTGFTENAFTVYGLFGLGAKTANTASYVFNGILVSAMMIVAILAFFKSRSRLDLILLSAFIFTFTFVMTSVADTLLIYPALVLLLVYGIITGDRRVLKLSGAFSMTTLLNTSYAMMIGSYFGSGENSLLTMMTASDPMLVIFSIVNVLLLGYFAYLVYDITVKEDIKGVVIIEGNYFKYAWSVIKVCSLAVARFFTESVPVFFTKKIPALFSKKEDAEDSDAGEGQ